MIQRVASPLSGFPNGETYHVVVDDCVGAPPVDLPAALLDRALGTAAVPSPPQKPYRIRRVRRSSISLARRRQERGEAFVAPEGHPSRFYRVSKRVFDLVGAAFLLAILSPILAGICLVLTVTTRGRPFFSQIRLGHRGKPFRMLKFRTMTIDAEARRGEVENEKDGPIFKNRNDARITRLGRLLRCTSLDETPQLLNVLLGQMSLVGPRPPIGEEVAEYEPWQRRRLSVKPGLTCLWQVSGRSEIEFEDWMRMDLWYVRNQRWRTDLELLVRTPRSVLSGRGAY
ncbi:MAG: sugar transferase [Pirellulales bacterium]|nr:sugar transferase [Pirellulales bacterium]